MHVLTDGGSQKLEARDAASSSPWNHYSPPTRRLCFLFGCFVVCWLACWLDVWFVGLLVGWLLGK